MIQCRTARGAGELWLTSAQSRRLISGTVSGNRSSARFIGSPPPDNALSDDGESGKSEHRQRDMAVPTAPGTDFVLVQSDLAFALFEQALDRPTQACDLRQPSERRALRRMGQIERHLRRVSDRAAHQQPMLEARSAAAVGDVGPVV